jgi:hypothetical protein
MIAVSNKDFGAREFCAKASTTLNYNPGQRRIQALQVAAGNNGLRSTTKKKRFLRIKKLSSVGSPCRGGDGAC